ncbi:Uncharacterized protein TCM_021640 [Theobroma cacao]|uniref:Uncharacterized protein n=1 Tax=Theobroma cacao TaxID=3641 RepID=A0A061ER50_THECC|nr:Uncharacterized protein TCM_021640 [Theobroma cacao]
MCRPHPPALDLAINQQLENKTLVLELDPASLFMIMSISPTISPCSIALKTFDSLCSAYHYHPSLVLLCIAYIEPGPIQEE